MAVRVQAGWVALGAAVVLVAGGCRERPAPEIEELAEAGYEMTQDAWFRAAESDDLDALNSMLRGGLSLDTRDAAGRSALHAAAGVGALKATDFLLERGIAVDATDAEGRTPLMAAVLRSTPETVRHFLRQGADPRAKDHDHYKPLMLAVKEGRREMVPELAPYVRQDLDDALLAAAILGQAGVIDELTNYGASIYARVPDGRTALMLAAQKGHADVVELLLEIGANRFARDADGRLAADLADLAGYGEIAARLDAAPREDDFELVPTAELGGEMVERVLAAEGGAVAASAGDAASDGGSVLQAEEAGESLAASNDGESSEDALVVSGEDDAGDAGGEGLGVEAADGGSAAVAVVDPELDPTADMTADPGADPVPGDPAMPSKPGQAARSSQPEPLEGAILGSVMLAAPDEETADAGTSGPASPVVMRSFIQRELPLSVVAVGDSDADLQIAGRDETVTVAEGDSIPGSSLKVVRIQHRVRTGKEGAGATDVSVVEVEDVANGVARELVIGLPALAHDPIALVEDAGTGRYYLARTGQRFRAADGTEFLVADVRPNQLVIEEVDGGITRTVPLSGPRG